MPKPKSHAVPVRPGSMSLNQVLLELGLRHRPARFPGQEDILRKRCRTVLFIGHACEVWDWLRKTGRVA